MKKIRFRRHHAREAEPPHTRGGRWPEGTHVTIGVGVTVALVFGILFGVAYMFPPKPGGADLAKASTLTAPASHQPPATGRKAQ